MKWVFGFCFTVFVVAYDTVLQLEAEVATRAEINLVVTSEKIVLPSVDQIMDFIHPRSVRVDVDYNGPYGFQVIVEAANSDYVNDRGFFLLVPDQTGVESLSYLLKPQGGGECLHSGDPVCLVSEQERNQPFMGSYSFDLFVPNINPGRVWGGDFLSMIQITFNEVK